MYFSINKKYPFISMCIFPVFEYKEMETFYIRHLSLFNVYLRNQFVRLKTMNYSKWTNLPCCCFEKLKLFDKKIGRWILSRGCFLKRALRSKNISFIKRTLIRWIFYNILIRINWIWIITSFSSTLINFINPLPPPNYV